MHDVLDAGAQGVHVPRINTRRDAEAVVEACRFHPLGTRSFFATARSGNYGIGVTEEEYAEASNRETLVTLQIEEEEGVRNIQETGEFVVNLAPDLGHPLLDPDKLRQSVVAEVRAFEKLQNEMKRLQQES